MSAERLSGICCATARGNRTSSSSEHGTRSLAYSDIQVGEFALVSQGRQDFWTALVRSRRFRGGRSFESVSYSETPSMTALSYGQPAYVPHL